MRYFRNVLIVLVTVLALLLTGCPFENASVSFVVGEINARTVFPDVKAENLTEITLKYTKAGEETETVKNWNTISDVTPIEIKTGYYNFTLSAKYCGFSYSGSLENTPIYAGNNTIAFNLNLSGLNEEEMNGSGNISHSLTFPKTENIDHITVSLYQYDETDELVIKAAEEIVTITDNEDGTCKASYTKQIASGKYIMKYRFYADEAETLCRDEYSTVIYVLKDVTSGADESTDMLCSVYTVTYELNGGNWVEGYTAPAQYTYLNGLKLPAAEKIVRPGYDFVKWSRENSSTGNEISEYSQQKDIKVYAIWQVRTDTEYTVKHWLQNIEDDEYKEDVSLRKTMKGTTDTETAADSEDITGFTAESFEQANIEGDESTVINVYYNRNIYKITFVLGSAVTETVLKPDGSLSGRYGAPVTIKDPVLEGYIFTGWVNENNQDEAIPETFTQNRTFSARFADSAGISLNFIREDVKIDSVAATLTTITVKAADGYSDYSWTVNGIKQEASINVVSFDADYLNEYRLVVTAKKNGIRYCTEAILSNYNEYINSLKEMVPVITEAVTITGDQSSGVFRRGRTVTLSPYFIGKYQVTQELYKSVMGTNPSYFSSNPADGETQELRPVEKINWYRAIAFCNRLSIKEGLEPCYSVKDAEGNEIDWAKLAHSNIPTSSNTRWDAAVCDMNKNGYRLPTEAEWEFAARGGDQSAADWNYEYAGSDTIDEVAWYDDNSGSKTHEVGKKKPNRLGLYDMSGNVWEWCWDWYDSVNSSETVTDPTGAASGSCRVQRGGSYYSLRCAVDYRDYFSPCFYNYGFGFRLVRSSSK